MLELIMTGRHFDVPAELREHIADRFLALAEDNPKLTSARVVMEIERGRQLAEIHLHGKNLSVDATASSHDMYVSFESAFDKIEKQVRRHLERIQDHRPKKGELKVIVEGEPSLAAEEEIEEEILEQLGAAELLLKE